MTTKLTAQSFGPNKNMKIYHSESENRFKGCNIEKYFCTCFHTTSKDPQNTAEEIEKLVKFKGQ